MDFIIQFIAKFFRNFRVKNPLVASIVLLLLATGSYTAAQGSLYGLFALPEWAGTVLSYVGLFLTAVTAPEVYPTLAKTKEK